MSGGRFDYNQYKIGLIADEIERIIENNKKPISEEDRDPWNNSEFYYNYSDEIVDKFKEAVDCLKKAEVYAQRIDWLVSGDNGDETFLRRLKEDLSKIEEIKK